MNEGQMNRQLQAGNAWWKQRDWQPDDRDLRSVADVEFDYKPAPLGGIVPGSLYVLRGPRRVGKSVEVKRAIAELVDGGIDPRRIIHFACDGLTKSELRLLMQVGRDIATHGVREPRYWFLDEVTAVKDWPPEIKWLRDNTDFGDDCVVLTGSSAHDLTQATKELAGRRGSTTSSDRLLLPMSFRAFCATIGLVDPPQLPVIKASEFLGKHAERAVYELQPWLYDLVNAWELFLTVGGFPQAVNDHLIHGAVQEDLSNSLWNIVYGDAIKTAGFSAPQAQALLVRLAKNLSSHLNVSSLAKDIGVTSHHTAQSRLDDLVEAYVAWPCYLKGDHNLPKLAAQNKIYFVDPLLARLAHLRAPQVDPPDSSVLTEQQIGLALMRQIEEEQPGTYSDFSSIMFMRTATKNEIDFVGTPLTGVPFEGKYIDKGWKRAAQAVKSGFAGGVLTTRSLIDTSEQVKAIPAPMVAWLLNQ